MLWGTLLEPVVRDEVGRRGYEIMPSPHVILDDAYPFMVGHLDGFVSEGISSSRGVYEGKTCGPFVKGWENDGVPVAYVAQATHYMHLAGLEWALLACLVGGQRLELRRVELDQGFLDLLLEAEAEFVDMCQAGTPPPPDGSASTDEMLKRLYPKAHAGTIVELTAADMIVVGEARALKAAVKETETQLKEREQTLKMRLGDNELGVYEGAQVVSYKSVTQERKAQDARTVEYRRLLL